MPMKRRYRVTVSRDRRETCVVEVEAAGPNEAAQEAFKICVRPSFPGWQVDDSDAAVFVPEGGVQEISA